MQISERDFLKELNDLAGQLRRDIEINSIGLDASPAAIKERRKRVLVDADFKFFAYTYFPHHIRGEPSFFQSDFCERLPKLLRLPNGVREWWIAPRGEAKSSLLTKIVPVYCAVQGLLQHKDIRQELGWQGELPPFIDYILLLGAESRLPKKLLEVVKTELEFNESLALDFPEVCDRGGKWTNDAIITKTNIRIEPFGAEQAVRGTFHSGSRPKLLLGDDLITDSEAKSPTERENRWNWLEKSIDYLGPPDGSAKYLGVGTILNKDDPISRAKRTVGHLVHHFKAIETLPTNMDLWEQCEELMRNADKPFEERAAANGDVVTESQLPSFKFYQDNKGLMDKGAVTSWATVRSLYNLMRARAKSRKAFNTEMQGDPRTDEDKVFTDIQFWVHKPLRLVNFAACDPSMGESKTSDPSSILVGGYDLETKKLYVYHAEIKRRVSSKLKSDLIAVQKEFNCQAIGFENNNAYEYMRRELLEQALEQNVQLPLVGVTASVPLEIRIESLEPFITGYLAKILLHSSQTQLIDELDTFPEKQTHHHYDGLCALHILWAIAVSRSGGLPQIKSRPQPRSAINGY